MLCRHCQEKRACRPRDLCWTCFYDPAVRALYSSRSKFGPRGTPDRCRRTVLPATPTAHAPGSEGRLAILEERAAAGLSLWHPDDALVPQETWDWRTTQATEAEADDDAYDRRLRLDTFGAGRGVPLPDTHPWKRKPPVMTPTATDLRTQGDYLASTTYGLGCPGQLTVDLFRHGGRVWRLTHGTWTVTRATAQDQARLRQRRIPV